MNSPSRPRLRGAVGLLATASLAVTGLVVTSTQAAHADGARPSAITDPCPAAYPAADLVTGQEYTALTVPGLYKRNGVYEGSATVPQEFTATYIDTLKDDSGDVYVFDLEGLNITKPNGDVDAGVWSGISGSPVYAADGRLIGAVSQTFVSGVTNRAGVTPADQLYSERDLAVPPSAQQKTAQPKTIKLSKQQQASLVRKGGQAQGTASSSALRTLTPPTVLGSVKGLKNPEATLGTFARRAHVAAPVIGGGNAAASEAPSSIVAGGNVAFSVSNGSLPMYDAGTAAAVCGSTVVAYGHPAYFAPYSRAMHTANAVSVERSGVDSFKLATLGPIVGKLLTDGLYGVVGQVGAGPASTEVTTTTSGVRPKTSTTQVVEPEALSFVVASQLARDIAMAMNKDLDGEAVLTWTIDYTVDGKAAQLKRANRYTSKEILTEEAPNDVASDVFTLQNQPFKKVAVTKVTVNTVTSPSYRAYKIGALKVRTGNRWVPVTSGQRITLPRSKYFRVQTALVPADPKSNVTPTTFEYRIRAPHSRAAGQLDFVGAYNYEDEWADDEDFFEDGDDEDFDEGPAYSTFAELIAFLKSIQRNDDIVTSWDRHTATVQKQTVKAHRQTAVTYGSAKLNISFR